MANIVYMAKSAWTGLLDTIRSKAGVTGNMTVSQAATAVENIETGGGGDDNFKLLGSLPVGLVNTTDKSSVDTGKTITVKGVYDYDLLICECSVDEVVYNRHTATTRLFILLGSSDISTKDSASVVQNTWNCKASSRGVSSTRESTTAYGVYANACTISAGSAGDNGQAVITIYQRYNANNTTTINGTYTMRVYGVKLYDLIGG